MIVCIWRYIVCLQEEVDVKKDTSRADQIRAMKKAWEDAEPGRAAKVLTETFQNFPIWNFETISFPWTKISTFSKPNSIVKFYRFVKHFRSNLICLFYGLIG